VGKFLSVVVTASAPGYDSYTKTLEVAFPIGTGPISNTAVPTISGTPVAGQTLTATDGEWSFTPDSVTLQWYAGPLAIPGATGHTLVLDDGSYVGKVITVKATAHAAGYPDATATSAATAPVKKAKVTLAASVSNKHPRVDRDQVTVNATVSAPDNLPLTGSIRVKVDGHVVDTVAVGSDGSAHITLPVFHTTGGHKVKVSFTGSDLLRKKSKTLAVFPTR
jgi:hypothetical protein